MADRIVEDQGEVMIAVVGFLLGFTAIFVALRFYTRAVLTDSLWWDDWTTLFAFFLIVAEGIIMCVHNSYGQGQHIKDLSPSMVRGFYKVLYITIVIYYFCLGVVKTAILLQYYRIFAARMRRVTVWTMVIIGAWSLSIVFLSAFMCNPVAGFWDHRIDAKCISLLRQWYINAGGNIVTDLIIFFMPIPVLWRLHLPLSQRISLIAVFAFGFFTCAISALRITFLDHADDMSYKNIGAAGWSLGELCCAIIGSCLPTLRPILGRMLPSVFGTRPRTQHSEQLAGFRDTTSCYRSRDTRSSRPIAGHFLPGRGAYRGSSMPDTVTDGDTEYGHILWLEARAARPVDEKNHGAESDGVSDERVMGLEHAVAVMQEEANRPPTPRASNVSAVSGLTNADGGPGGHLRTGTFTTIRASGGFPVSSRNGILSGIQVQTDLVTVLQRQ